MVAKEESDLKVDAVEEKYHFRGIGEQLIPPFVQLQVLGALGGQDAHYASRITDGITPPLVGNDRLLPCSSSMHVYLGDCWLKIPSKGIKAKLMVTTSNHVLVNMAFLAMISKSKKMSWLRNDLKKTKTHLVVRVTERLEYWYRLRVMQMLCPRSADAEELTTKQEYQEIIIHLPPFRWVPRCSRVEEATTIGYTRISCLRKLNGTRGHITSATWQQDSDVAATFTSQATGKSGQHVVDIFAINVNDVQHGALVEMTKAHMKTLTESKTQATTTFTS